jgi:glycosyltransferase involved in cell wall biosynthesis
MELIVLDNGLVSRGAHSYHMALALDRELQRLGIRHRIFAARKAAPEVASETGAAPFFRRDLYESVRRPALCQLLQAGFGALAKKHSDLPFDSARSEVLTFKTLNRDYRRDLRRLRAVWKPDNVVLIAGLSQNELLGLVTHLLSLPAPQRPTVICQLMFSPSWTSWGAESVHGHAYYARIFKLAAPLVNRSLFFVCETSSQAAQYTDAFDVPVGVVPIPLAAIRQNRRGHSDGPRIRFGYFGYSKTAKGFHLLPKAIEICEARGLDAEFVVQVNHTAWEPAVIEAERVLERSNRVRLVTGELSSERYYALFRQVDAILLPYDSREYGQRGSGILVEAVSSGYPIVASLGTWGASAILEGKAAGEIFETFDSAALADAICRLAEGMEANQEAAESRATAFAAHHTPQSYVAALLAIAEKRKP